MKIYLCVIFTILSINNCLGQDLGKEANDQFKKFIADRFLNHKGDAYLFSVHSSQSSSRTSSDMWQIKNLASNLKNSTITDIEKLNGFEWKGEINFKALGYRRISWSNSFDRKFEDAIWDEWRVFIEVNIILIKKRGEWRFVNSDSFGFFSDNFVPKAQDIDQLLLRPMVNIR